MNLPYFFISAFSFIISKVLTFLKQYLKANLNIDYSHVGINALWDFSEQKYL